VKATGQDVDERLSPKGWDAGAFESVYRAHSGAVHAVACRVASPRVADDVTQEVFLRLWRHPERFDPARGSLSTFLVTVTHNAAVDVMRAETARRARERRDAFWAPTDSVAATDYGVLQGELRATVDQALDRLRPDERVAIVTAYFGGCTYREVAIVLDVAEGTVKSRIRSGLRRLNDLLAPSGVLH